ncbi:MAG: prolipoprotein diacylglyceryl transferase [Chloroflexota bacterium]|nr:MAG: prolipoprotein diacylglyceryl transferase [Chloroflexota bacterium]
MSKQKSRFTRPRVEPYWYLIGLFIAGAAFFYIRHLATQETPSRVAVHIAQLNFDIFWYGIFIVSGIALGTWVTARLAAERAEISQREHVPAKVRRRPTTDLALPEEISGALEKRSLTAFGQLLLEWGLNPNRLGLNRAGQDQLLERLESEPEIKEEWLSDAPWRVWNPDFAWAGVAWCLIFAIVGARLYHVLTPSPSMAALGIESAWDYFRSPMQLINVRSGGLGIYGGIVGGALGLFLYTHRQRISTIAWADIAVVGLALGQFIGRWGNFFNQELYGQPTDLPWAVYIDPIYRLDAYVNSDRFHPAFLYESLWSLLTFFVLLTLARRHYKKLQVGDLTALYLVFFAVGRILLEVIRLDSRNVSLAGVDFGIPVATLVSIIIAIPMAGLLLWRHVLQRDQP